MGKQVLAANSLTSNTTESFLRATSSKLGIVSCARCASMAVKLQSG
jgi:hypothetical protein